MKRIVVKVGTNVLSKDDGSLNVEFLKDIVEQIVELRIKGVQVILVTSGAVGAGKSLISLQDIKSEVVQKQIFAAVGQVKLMTIYSEFFTKHNYYCAQVLTTKEDFRDEEHYANMRNCFEGLLLDSVIPIVNENDVVATTELLFTDNDELAGLVSELLNVDSLIMLTSTDGILDNNKETIQEINPSNIEDSAGYISQNKSASGRGGMVSKFKVAKDLSEKGVTVYIANGKRKNVLLELFGGIQSGTVFVAQN